MSYLDCVRNCKIFSIIRKLENSWGKNILDSIIQKYLKGDSIKKYLSSLL